MYICTETYTDIKMHFCADAQMRICISADTRPNKYELSYWHIDVPQNLAVTTSRQVEQNLVAKWMYISTQA